MTHVSKLWNSFRGLPRWIQAVAWVVFIVAVLAAIGEEPDEVNVEAAGPTTTVAEPAPITTTTTSVPAGVPAGDDTTVTRVVDGDTIQVAGGTRVRLIGVDAPEMETPAGCFAPEATRYLNELLPVGTPVRLAYDVERLDQYGRTLAYVYKLTDGVFVNRAVLRNGFASQLTVSPNVNHADAFRAAAAEARAGTLGLWSACQTITTAARVTVPPTTAAPVTAAPVTSPPVTRGLVAPATTATTAASSGGCHPSYAGACVPTGFSDVDCAGGGGNGPGYVSAKRFQVIGDDVYGLDGNDNDGIACES